ncbi:MAG: YigZ family protein [Bernardetiaceae bacterium]|nr:YigZ family protein [Bernardetiaceae bacterium]
MKDSIRSLRNESEGFYKEKGSKFLAHAMPVASEEDVKEALEQLRTKYHDARHHCYAYILGWESERFRANDDGEPNNSAGIPILNQIRSFELSDTLVVVVRYFGGTKLGVSGLIQAYKIAAQEALDKAEIYEKINYKQLQIRYRYEQTNEVMRLIDQHSLTILNQNFAADCEATLQVRAAIYAQVKADFEAL